MKATRKFLLITLSTDQIPGLSHTNTQNENLSLLHRKLHHRKINLDENKDF